VIYRRMHAKTLIMKRANRERGKKGLRDSVGRNEPGGGILSWEGVRSKRHKRGGAEISPFPEEEGQKKAKVRSNRPFSRSVTIRKLGKATRVFIYVRGGRIGRRTPLRRCAGLLRKKAPKLLKTQKMFLVDPHRGKKGGGSSNRSREAPATIGREEITKS